MNQLKSKDTCIQGKDQGAVHTRTQTKNIHSISHPKQRLLVDLGRSATTPNLGRLEYGLVGIGKCIDDRCPHPRVFSHSQCSQVAVNMFSCLVTLTRHREILSLRYQHVNLVSPPFCSGMSRLPKGSPGLYDRCSSKHVETSKLARGSVSEI